MTHPTLAARIARWTLGVAAILLVTSAAVEAHPRHGRVRPGWRNGAAVYGPNLVRPPRSRAFALRQRAFRSNPPGPAGGPGTNWANPPGPRGGRGSSPYRLRPYRSRPWR